MEVNEMRNSRNTLSDLDEKIGNILWDLTEMRQKIRAIKKELDGALVAEYSKTMTLEDAYQIVANDLANRATD